MKIKTSELTGAALDWAVAKCKSRTLKRNPMGSQGGHGWWVWEETPSSKGGIILGASVYMEVGPRIQPKTRNSCEKFSPSTDWSQGGPIVEDEGITIVRLDCNQWAAANGSYRIQEVYGSEGDHCGDYYHVDDDAVIGPAPLIAAMRCYVASKLGDEVEVPDELLK